MNFSPSQLSVMVQKVTLVQFKLWKGIAFVAENQSFSFENTLFTVNCIWEPFSSNNAMPKRLWGFSAAIILRRSSIYRGNELLSTLHYLRSFPPIF